MGTSKVTRVELVDHTKPFTEGGGRAFVRYGVRATVELQDDDQTLKVFIEK